MKTFIFGGPRLWVAIIVALSAPIALAQDQQFDSLDPGLIWADVTAARLDVEFPGDGYHASWFLHRCECGDLLIESELNVPGDVEKGELLLVGQRAVLERGFRSEELETQMSWDAPALMLQLAGQLLARSMPAGPASVTEKTIVTVSDEKEGIALDSGNAVGGFPAPWEVTAMAEPAAGSKRRFDLKFSFAIPGSTEMADMNLKGTVDYAERDFPLDENLPLAGWKLTWRIKDDVASSASDIDTIADLRELIERTAQENSVSPP